MHLRREVAIGVIEPLEVVGHEAVTTGIGTFQIVHLPHILDERAAGARRLIGIVPPVDLHAEHGGNGHISRPDPNIRDVVIGKGCKAAVETANHHFELKTTVLALFSEGMAAEIVEPDSDGDMIDASIIPHPRDGSLTAFYFSVIDFGNFH
jgi:hypothetical protein